jgi:hypothetical protein
VIEETDTEELAGIGQTPGEPGADPWRRPRSAAHGRRSRNRLPRAGEHEILGNKLSPDPGTSRFPETSSPPIRGPRDFQEKALLRSGDPEIPKTSSPPGRGTRFSRETARPRRGGSLFAGIPPSLGPGEVFFAPASRSRAPVSGFSTRRRRPGRGARLGAGILVVPRFHDQPPRRLRSRPRDQPPPVRADGRATTLQPPRKLTAASRNSWA